MDNPLKADIALVRESTRPGEIQVFMDLGRESLSHFLRVCPKRWAAGMRIFKAIDHKVTMGF